MKNSTIKGYKVFNSDWTCRGFQYEVGRSYEMDDAPVVCDRGFHFCLKASDCFNFYDFDSNNRVAEIEAYGEIDMLADESKYCTNKIRIVREIPWDEVLRIVNEGKDCTGLCNTGDRNTGDWNTGDWNTGDRNTGDWNTGDRNTGDWNTGNWNTGNWNTGDWNTGNWNTGDRNTGDWNTGNRNTGDWNISSFNNGCFMTVVPKIMLFNKPSDWTYEMWINSRARYLLNQIPRNVVEWVCGSDMTDEEKAQHPEYETTEGYLKVLDESDCAQEWWNGLDDEDKQEVISIPNFDKDIFEEITGIRI